MSSSSSEPIAPDHSPSPVAARRRVIVAILIVAAIVAVIIALVAIATRSGDSGQYSVVDGKIAVNATTVGKLGTVLVTNTGYALYTFPPDHQREVTCTDACALHWPPLVVPKGAHLVAGDGVQASRLSTVSAPNGDTVATYDGWPLYTFQGDVAPGGATGQGQYLDGGYWYVIRPDGDVVKPTPDQ